MNTSKDDYLINSLRFVSAKDLTWIYGAILPECLTSPAIKENSDLVPVDEEPVTKGKRVKRPTKKSTTKPVTGVVIKEAPVETKSKSKEKEKLDVTHGKGIKLLSKVAMTEEAQMKEITPTVTWGNDEDDSNDEQESSNEGSEQENESEEQEPDSEQDEEFEDDDQKEEEFVHTPTDDKDDDDLESESDDVNKSNEECYDVNKSDEESDDLIKGDKEIVQGEGADAEMIDAQRGNETLETTQEQVVEDAHVTISTVMKKTEVPVTSSSCSSDLASKF
ncbi:hypothetical protein Tco_1259988 [Tanacetum coccineum]